MHLHRGEITSMKIMISIFVRDNVLLFSAFSSFLLYQEEGWRSLNPLSVDEHTIWCPGDNDVVLIS